MALGYDGTIRIDSRIDTRGFNAGISAMTNSLRSLAAAVGVAFGVAAVFTFGKAAVNAASELGSALVGLQSILDGTGKSFSAAQKFLDDYVADGLVPMKDAIIAYKNLALRGYNDEQIRQTMIALKDSAAFGRQAALTMGEAISRATEGLKNENSLLVDNAGVTKNVAVMWAEWAKAHGKSVESMTKAEKIMAEVNGILEETRFQTGDAAKLTDTYAGKVAVLSATFMRFKTAVGRALIPILSQIIPIINAVIARLTVFVETFAAVMEALFGKQATAIKGVADGTRKAAEAQEELAKNTEDSKKAAKGALAAFDELNVLYQKSEDESAVPGAPDMPSEILPDEVTDPNETESKVSELRDKILTILQPAIDAFNRLRTALEPLGGKIWDGLKWAWDNILVPLGEWGVTVLLPHVLDLVAQGAETLDSILTAAQPTLKWFWEEFLKPAAEWVGDRIIDGLEFLTEKLKDLSDWAKENPEKIQLITKVLLLLGVVLLAIAAATAIWSAVAGVAAAVTTAFGAAVAFLTSPIATVVLAIIAIIAIIVLLVKHWDWVKEQAGKAWDWIVDKWKAAAKWFDSKVVQPIKDFFGDLWNNLKDSAATAWKNVSGKWDDAKAWFSEKVTTPIKNFFGNLWTNIKDGAATARKNVSEKWSDAKVWFSEKVTAPIKTSFGDLWKNLKDGAATAWKNVSKEWDNAKLWFSEKVTTPIKTAFNNAWEDTKRAWNGAKTWFQTTVTNPIGEAFDIVTGNIDRAWKNVWNGLGDFLRGAVNTVIDLINTMLRALSDGMNEVINAMNTIRVTVPDWVPFIGGSTWSLNIPYVPTPQIPRLASGAVIPPNSEFLAVLGDQRSGKNIETPEGLLRQIIQEELGKIEADIKIEFGGSLGALVRELKPIIDKETVRIGKSLVQGI